MDREVSSQPEKKQKLTQSGLPSLKSLNLLLPHQMVPSAMLGSPSNPNDFFNDYARVIFERNRPQNTMISPSPFDLPRSETKAPHLFSTLFHFSAHPDGNGVTSSYTIADMGATSISNKITPSLSTINTVKGQAVMYGDPQLSKAVKANEQINKDIIFYCLLTGVPLGKDKDDYGTRVSIDDKVHYTGKRKSFQLRLPKKPNSLTLQAELRDFHTRKPVALCANCLKKSDQILKIRSATEEEPGNVKITASVICSGNPPKSDRALTVCLWMTDSENNMVWEAETPPFTVLHHRSKKFVNNNNSLLQQNQNEMLAKESKALALRAKEEIETLPSLTNPNKLLHTVTYVQKGGQSSFQDSLEKVMYNLVLNAMNHIWEKQTEEAKFSFSNNFNVKVMELKTSPNQYFGLEKFMEICNVIGELGDFEYKLEEACFKGTLEDGKISTKQYVKGKWTKAIGGIEATGEEVIIPSCNFWNVKNGKLVGVETLSISQHKTEDWATAWTIFFKNLRFLQ